MCGLAIGLGYLLPLFAVRGLPVGIIGLVGGAIAITAVVVVRQVLTVRENHELAITDVLTGLSNRRHLHDMLRLALARSARSGERIGVLLLDLIAELDTPVLIGEVPVPMRASIGIALCPLGEVDPDRLLHRADLAMHRAKGTTRQTGATSLARYDCELDAEYGMVRGL